MFEAVAPGVPDPSLAFVEEAGIRALPSDVHWRPGVLRNQDVPAQPGRLLVNKLIREAEIRGEVRPHPGILRLVEWNDDSSRSLWRSQVVAVYIELVLFGFAAEYGVLIEHQNRSVRPPLSICPARREARDSAAHDNHVGTLAGVHGSPKRFVELLVADASVSSIHHFMGVAVGSSIVSDPTGPAPVGAETGHFGSNRLRLRSANGCWRGHSEQRRTRADQGSPDEIAARQSRRVC